MKTRIIILAIFFFITIWPAFPAAKKNTIGNVDYTVGAKLSFTRIPVWLNPQTDTETKTSNTLSLSYLDIYGDVALSEYITLGLSVGYASHSMRKTVEFNTLPLSVQLQGKTFAGVLLGVHARSNFFSWDNFTFQSNAQVLTFMESTQNLPVTLDLAKGNAEIKHSITESSIDLLVQYEGLSSCNIYAGPQLAWVSGDYKVNETIETLQGSQELSYKQKKLFGIIAGAHMEVGNFDIKAELSLFSRTGVGVRVYYML